MPEHGVRDGADVILKADELWLAQPVPMVQADIEAEQGRESAKGDEEKIKRRDKPVRREGSRPASLGGSPRICGAGADGAVRYSDALALGYSSHPGIRRGLPER